MRVVDVAVGLALESVGLEERDVVAERRNLLQHAAIIGGGTVPVG
ncbi:hypothetical protein ACVWWG_008416 [Bradyrhizobium sp. LB7.2]